MIENITTNLIVNDLYNNFQEYPNIKGTGNIKKHTIKMVDNYIDFIINKSIENTNYKIIKQHNIYITNEFSICLDRAILDFENNIKMHIELKAYGDIDMLKRFIADSHCLLKHSPNIINIALCMQPATPTDTFISMAHQFDTIYNKNTYLFTLTDKYREYRNDKSYIFNYDRQDIVDRTMYIINKLSGLIPQ